jgi:hypothetical protein
MTTKNVKPFFTATRGVFPPSSKTRYPFSSLKVGCYFDAPRDLDHAVRVRASQHGKKYGRTYSVRRVDAHRVRVYRLA